MGKKKRLNGGMSKEEKEKKRSKKVSIAPINKDEDRSLVRPRHKPPGYFPIGWINSGDGE